MYRIDNATAITPMPAVAVPGPNPNSFFTGGNPGAGQLATIVDADWANTVQEELVAVVLGAGLALDKADHDQVLEAIGILKGRFAGSTSGLITVQAQAIAGTYNFNLPTSAGASGAPLLSGGGGASPMTFGTVTGSGNFVKSASPVLTGTVDAEIIEADGVRSLRGTLAAVASGAWQTIWTAGSGSYRATGGAGCSTGSGGAVVDASKDNGSATVTITGQTPFGAIPIAFQAVGGVLQIRQTSGAPQTLDWSLLIIPHSV
jgi:hypothetical protein